jgi:hypothetical protein
MAEETRTPLQQLNDYLYSQVAIVRQTSSNKRLRCRKCNHNFSGNPGRIHEHLKCKPGDVKGCTFSVTNDKREVWDEIDALVHALPSSKKRKVDYVSDTENAGSSGLRQMPIQESMQAAGKAGVDQALADWVYETGIPFNVFR